MSRGKLFGKSFPQTPFKNFEQKEIDQAIGHPIEKGSPPTMWDPCPTTESEGTLSEKTETFRYSCHHRRNSEKPTTIGTHKGAARTP